MDSKGYSANIIQIRLWICPRLDRFDYEDGTYVRVRNVTHADGINRPEIHYYSNGTSDWYTKKATIEIRRTMESK